MNERDIFVSALEIEDRAARQAHVQTACVGNPELLARVESLLALNETQSQFLETPIVEQIASESDADRTATQLFGNDSTNDEEVATGSFASRGTGSRTMRHDDEERDEVSLPYLEPSSQPGSIGRFAHYEIREVLGRGAFGTVLKAFDEKLQRVVAIKVLAPEVAATSPARKRFLREARASAAIRHENIVNIHTVEEQPLPYLVMEYIPGQTLQQRLDSTGPLPVSDVLRLGRQIAEGLAAAHSHNLIHRDIKPGNILLEAGIHDRVKITDFGLARAVDDASMTQSGLIAGTPLYMAPEQALGKKLDQRADLFSLGSVLYQMVSGRAPFRATSTLAVLKRVVEDTPRPIPEIIPETPPWLCDIITKLHAKNPDDRYQSAREVADVLANCEKQLQFDTKLQDFSRNSDADPARSGKWTLLTAGGAAVVMLLLGVIVITLTNRDGTKTRIEVQEGADVRINPGAGSRVDITAGDQTNTIKPSHEPVPTIPLTDADIQRIAALPAGEQVEEVRQELMKRNPGFDGTVQQKIEDNSVAEFNLITDHVTDISPLRALMRVQRMGLNGSGQGMGSLADLSSLQGMKLVELSIGNNQSVKNVSALQGMPLKKLTLYYASATDLTPLAGMPLEYLLLWGWTGSDLTPLRGMPLKWLNCGGGGGSTQFDLAPLAGLPLEFLCINHTQVSDLAPLRNVPLKGIELTNTKVTDFSPLKSIATLEKINKKPSADFWKEMELARMEPDRRAAEYVLSMRGVVWINGQDDARRYQGLRSAADLPQESFRLTKFDLHGNLQVKDTDLAVFADCKHVGIMYLYVCQQVTDAGLAHFKNCQQLTELHLQGTKITNAGLAQFKGTRTITAIYLDNTGVTDAGLQNFKDCTKMTHIALTGLPVTDAGLEHFRNCQQLQMLRLSSTKVTDAGLALFQNHKYLRELSIRATKVTDFSLLKALPLKLLTCDFQPARDAAILRSIKTLDRINDKPVAEFWKEVELARTEPDRRAAEHVIALGGFVHINESVTPIRTNRDLPAATFQLKYVGFYGNKIVTDADLMAFQDCTSLWSLDLTYTAVTNHGLRHIRNCPNLQVLNLAHTTVDDDGLAELKNFPKLRTLNLGYTRVTDHGLAQIKDLPRLVELLILNTSVTDAGMVHLADCTPLTSLNLNGTAVTDAALVHFTGLKNLTLLKLNKTKVTAKGIEELTKSLPNCKIEWDGAQP